MLTKIYQFIIFNFYRFNYFKRLLFSRVYFRFLRLTYQEFYKVHPLSSPSKDVKSRFIKRIKTALFYLYPILIHYSQLSIYLSPISYSSCTFFTIFSTARYKAFSNDTLFGKTDRFLFMLLNLKFTLSTAFVVYITVLTFTLNLNMDVIASHFEYQLLISFGYLLSHLSATISRLFWACSPIGALYIVFKSAFLPSLGNFSLTQGWLFLQTFFTGSQKALILYTSLLDAY